MADPRPPAPLDPEGLVGIENIPPRDAPKAVTMQDLRGLLLECRFLLLPGDRLGIRIENALRATLDHGQDNPPTDDATYERIEELRRTYRPNRA